MKRRLTLTIDPGVAHQAKRTARHRNTSLSALVEDLLRATSPARPPPETPVSFSTKWGGKLRVLDRDDTRFRHLADKYNL